MFFLSILLFISSIKNSELIKLLKDKNLIFKKKHEILKQYSENIMWNDSLDLATMTNLDSILKSRDITLI